MTCAPESESHYNARAVTQWHKDNNTNLTGYLGVRFRKLRGVYEARIRVHGRKNKLHIGTGKTAEEAARMYDAKARELYGPTAVVNFPPEAEFRKEW